MESNRFYCLPTIKSNVKMKTKSLISGKKLHIYLFQVHDRDKTRARKLLFESCDISKQINTSADLHSRSSLTSQRSKIDCKNS